MDGLDSFFHADNSCFLVYTLILDTRISIDNSILVMIMKQDIFLIERRNDCSPELWYVGGG